ncbi:hypothetical protein ACFXKW_34080 [Streptomyces sp. NPDC059193]|uniref:hypothetical protein n=1 Tax=Streptomyces sp. NPDC059193 TaxID=3346763 RepID=UPI003682E771
MGTGSKSSHQSYAVSPTAVAESPTAPVELGGVLVDEGDVIASEAGPVSGEPQASGDQLVLDEAGASAGPDTEPAVLEADVDEFLQEQFNQVDGPEAEEMPQTATAQPEEGEGALQEPAPEEGEATAQEAGQADSDVPPGDEDQPLPEEPEEEKDPPLTPVPAAPPVGAPTGVPLLVGGDDFINSEATLVAYDSADGPREVLLTHISEDAEDRLLDALSIAGTHTEEIEVEEQFKGRLDLDKKMKLAELTTTAVTSVQHKLNHDLPMSEASIAKHAKAVDAVTAVLNDPGASEAEKAMAQHYMDQLDMVKDKIDNGGAPMAWMDTYEVTGPKMVTKQVQVSDGEPEPGTLVATVRKASRIKAALDSETGQSSWDGVTRSHANGTEYEIDMGDGWKAVYRPYKENDPTSTEYSLRGQLEVHAPQGSGNGEQLVERLEQLHLMNKPMTAAEGEWTYLANNIQAQKLEKAAGMKTAMETAQGLQDLQVQEIVHQRMESLMGLDSDDLQTQMKRIHLEAAHKVLPMKVQVVRDAVAKASGFTNGSELAASPGYDPAPTTDGRWLTWSRFDVTGKHEEIQSAFTGRALTHSIGDGDIASLLGTGVLASTEKRAVMGIGSGIGQSEQSDKLSGGANSVFLRVNSDSGYYGGGTLIWDDPSVLMRRSDYYGYNGDHYGAINPDHHNYSKSAITRDPMKIASFGGGSNEVMFRNGIDLLGAEAPSRIVCGSAGERNSILSSLSARGITELGGKPVEDVLCVTKY